MSAALHWAVALDGPLAKWFLFHHPVLEALLTSFCPDPTHLQTTNELINTLTVLLPNYARNLSARSSATPHPSYRRLKWSRKTFLYPFCCTLNPFVSLGVLGISRYLVLYVSGAVVLIPSPNPLGSQSETECTQSVSAFSKHKSSQRRGLASVSPAHAMSHCY